MSNRDKVNDALSVIRADYFEDIRSYAEDIKQAIIDGELTDMESIDERVWETCDNSQWVIYTFQAQLVLLCSDNDSCGIDEMGADSFDWSSGVPWSQLAFCAMRQDLMDQLEAEGIDWSIDSWMSELDQMEREEMIETLNSASIECRDDEPDSTLRKAIITNILDGTIAL